jgi:hypothetical protein
MTRRAAGAALPPSLRCAAENPKERARERETHTERCKRRRSCLHRARERVSERERERERERQRIPIYDSSLPTSSNSSRDAIPGYTLLAPHPEYSLVSQYVCINLY